MRRKLLAITAVLAASLIVVPACDDEGADEQEDEQQQQDQDQDDEQAEGPHIELVNESGEPFSEVNVAETGATDWGDDALERATLESGESDTISVSEGAYDVRVHVQGEDAPWVWWDVDVAGPETLTAEHGLRVVSNMSFTVEDVQISPVDHERWGDNRLGDLELDRNEAATVPVEESGHYDVRLIDEDRDEYDRFALPIDGIETWEVDLSYLGQEVVDDEVADGAAKEDLHDGDALGGDFGDEFGDELEEAFAEELEEGFGDLDDIDDFDPDSIGEDVEFELSNSTDEAFEAVYTSSSGLDWGDDQLGGDTLEPGDSHTLSGPAMGTSIKIEVEGEDVPWKWWHLTPEEGEELTLEHGVRVVNNTDEMLFMGYASPTPTDDGDWGRDVFGPTTVEQGEGIGIPMDGAEDHYDVKLETLGDSEYVRWGVPTDGIYEWNVDNDDVGDTIVDEGADDFAHVD